MITILAGVNDCEAITVYDMCKEAETKFKRHFYVFGFQLNTEEHL